MENIITLTQEIESGFLKSKLKIDNSSNFKDFEIQQKFIQDENESGEYEGRNLTLGIDAEAKSLIIAGVTFEGLTLEILKNFINQI